ncbi:glandular kallikrein, prostatic-like [Prorops nasuta]|uniref:glandular kallikrein, prostatic-like n=1 Tax=Prorops nasuta TaxID=863751 RepID=UPI0034D020FD
MSKFIMLVLLLWRFKETENIFLKGKRALEGQFPWLVQFQTITPCGGVLLSSDWVLTAAQCVQDKRNSIVLFSHGLHGQKSGQTTANVKATYVHPQYQAYSAIPDYDYNIALLKLVQPLAILNPLSYLELAPLKLDNNYKACLIFGWQSILTPNSKLWAKPIMYHEVFLNSWKLCSYMAKDNNSYSNVFCTLTNSVDEPKICAGNPGSPVVCQDQFNKSFLLGIASWTKFSLDCGEFPKYLSINSFRSWIYNLINGTKFSQDLIHENKNDSSKLPSEPNIKLENLNTNYSNLGHTASFGIHLNNGKSYTDTSINVAFVTNRLPKYKRTGTFDSVLTETVFTENSQYSEKSSTRYNRIFKKSKKGMKRNLDSDSFLSFDYNELYASSSNNKKLYINIFLPGFVFLNIILN